MEQWIDIKEFDNHYQISNFGRVKRKQRIALREGKSPFNISERISKEQDNGKGYKQIYISIQLKRKILYIHRLVAQYFIANESPELKTFVNHIDGNKSNNLHSNLEWVTHQENINHSVLNNLNSKGETSGTNTLTEMQVLEIRKICSENSLINKSELARKYNVKDTTVHKIIRRQRWRHI